MNTRLESTLELLQITSLTLLDSEVARIINVTTAGEWSNRWQAQPLMRQLHSMFSIPQPILINTGSRR